MMTNPLYREFAEKLRELRFSLLFTEVTYTPVKRESNIVIQPMKELRDLKNGSITVHGPEVLQCSPVDYHDPSQTTVPTTQFPTTSTHPTVSQTILYCTCIDFKYFFQLSGIFEC